MPFYLYLPAQDHEDYEIYKFFNQTYEFIEQARKNTNVLVHCMAGVSRSVTIVTAYLLKKFKCSLGEVIRMLQRKRSKVRLLLPRSTPIRDSSSSSRNTRRKRDSSAASATRKRRRTSPCAPRKSTTASPTRWPNSAPSSMKGAPSRGPSGKTSANTPRRARNSSHSARTSLTAQRKTSSSGRGSQA